VSLFAEPLFEPAIHDRRISVDAAIAQEGPVLAHFFLARGVAIGERGISFLVRRGLSDHLPEGVGYKRRSPELDA